MVTSAQEDPQSVAEPLPQLEAFLQAVERKTTDEVHRRLLKAARDGDPATAIEVELGKVISEILHET